MPKSSVNGVQLYWEVEGDGEPVIFVHGSWGDHHNWDQVAPAFSDSFRVATYDRRGHSGSERPGAQGRISDDVADLAALIQHVFEGPAHVVGNSFGAIVSLRLAARRPELIRSLVVHEPPMFGVLETHGEPAAALAAVGQRISAVVSLLEAGDMAGGAERFVETIAFGPGAWSQLPQAVRDTFIFNAPTWLDEIRDPDSPLAMDLSALSSFTRPALISSGGKSPPFFPTVVERVAQVLPHAKRHVFPQAGHVPHLTHPHEYVTVVGGFIREAAGRPAASAA